MSNRTPLSHPVRRGFNSVYAGQITDASTTSPDIGANIRYSARALDPGMGQSITISQTRPINRITSDDSMVEIVPSKIGDPCVVIRYFGVTLLAQLTERFAEGECPSEAQP